MNLDSLDASDASPQGRPSRPMAMANMIVDSDSDSDGMASSPVQRGTNQEEEEKGHLFETRQPAIDAMNDDFNSFGLNLGNDYLSQNRKDICGDYNLFDSGNSRRNRNAGNRVFMDINDNSFVYFILFCFVFCYFVLFCFVLFYFSLFYFTLFCFFLFCYY